MRICFSILWLVCLAPALSARTWTDKSGKYTIDAELFACNETHVVLQRKDGQLGMYDLDIFSKEDQDYLQSEEGLNASTSNLRGDQLWTLTDGAKIAGHLVDYAQLQVTIQRRRGKAYINDRLYDGLPPVYQAIVRRSVGVLEGISDVDEQKFMKWLRDQKGVPKVYNIDGLIMELKDGNEYMIPFFLFDGDSLSVLKDGWDEWLAAADDHRERQQESFRLQSAAAAMQQREIFNQKIAMANLGLNSIRAGVTSLWEVTLYPGPGNPSPPRWVTVPGADSQVATQNALRQYPGFVTGAIRKITP